MKWIAFALAACTLAACNNSGGSASSTTNDTAANAAQPDTSSKSEWVRLFDGTTTTGWHSYGKPTADATWKVMDGSLMMDTTVKNGTDLVTDGTYDNFDLKLE